jgi:hypothetical protein
MYGEYKLISDPWMVKEELYTETLGWWDRIKSLRPWVKYCVKMRFVPIERVVVIEKERLMIAHPTIITRLKNELLGIT